MTVTSFRASSIYKNPTRNLIAAKDAARGERTGNRQRNDVTPLLGGRSGSSPAICCRYAAKPRTMRCLTFCVVYVKDLDDRISACLTVDVRRLS